MSEGGRERQSVSGRELVTSECASVEFNAHLALRTVVICVVVWFDG